MGTIFKSLLAASISLVATTSVAQTKHTYVLAAYSGSTAVFGDSRSMVREKGGDVTAWSIWVFDPPVPPSDLETRKSSYMMSRDKYDCHARTMATLYSSYYDDQGSVIIAVNSPGKANPIVPDSLGEGVFDAVCKGLKGAGADSAQEAVSQGGDLMKIFRNGEAKSPGPRQ